MKAGEHLLSYGLPGIAILALGWALFHKDRQLTEARQETVDVLKDMAEAQREMERVLAENTQTATTQAQSFQALTQAILISRGDRQ